MKFLGCRDVDQKAKIEEMLKSEKTLEHERNTCGLQGDFGSMVERLLVPMRQDYFSFQGELKYLNLPGFSS